MPISSNAFRSVPPNGYDFYVMVIDKDFDHLIYGSYIGGSLSQEHVDGGTSRFDKNGVMYQSVCGGCGKHSDFPTTPSAWSTLNLSNNCNNVLFKFDFGIIPSASITASKNIICLGESIKLENNSTVSDSYLWNFGTSKSDTSSLIFSPTIKYTSSGIYNVLLTVTNKACQLTDSAFVKVTVLDSIKLSVNNDTVLCKPAPLFFTAKNFGSGRYFIWSSVASFSDTLNSSVLDSTLMFTPTKTGYYYIKAGNDLCYKKDSVFVEVISSYIKLVGNNKLCFKEESLLSAVNSNPLIPFVYSWTPDSVLVTNSTLSQVSISPKTNSQYVYLAVNNSMGCSFNDSILLTISTIDSLLVKASSSDVLVPKGGMISLSALPNGYHYSWLPSTVVTSPSSQNTTAKVFENTLFTVSISDDICTKSATILIKVYDYICDDPSVYIANAFSPNGDGNNDVLNIHGQMIKVLTFRIFDRWGEMVFETHERGVGWDGTYKGKKLDPDVYDYYLKVKCIDNVDSVVKGNVTLLK